MGEYTQFPVQVQIPGPGVEPRPPQMASFWTELIRTGREGVLLAVKYGLLLAGLLFAANWVVTDYLQTRVAATRGQAAFEFIQQQLNKQQGEAAARPTESAPIPRPQGAK